MNMKQLVAVVFAVLFVVFLDRACHTPKVNARHETGVPDYPIVNHRQPAAGRDWPAPYAANPAEVAKVCKDSTAFNYQQPGDCTYKVGNTIAPGIGPAPVQPCSTAQHRRAVRHARHVAHRHHTRVPVAPCPVQ